jgi:hypothetical protein
MSKYEGLKTLYMPCEYCGREETQEVRGQVVCRGCGAPSREINGYLEGKPISFDWATWKTVDFVLGESTFGECRFCSSSG